MHERNDTLIPNARNLRKNMTKEERHLWYDFLRDCGVRFRRQEIIGNYIADFYCSSAKLVIELDGSQHYMPEIKEKDSERTHFLESLGFRVMRFSNLDVLQNFEGVCEAILTELEKGTTPQSRPRVRSAVPAPLSGEPNTQPVKSIDE